MNTINTDEIISDLEAKGIRVVPITYSNSKATRLKGNLENFLQTVKVFNENVVFVAEFTFDNESFFHEPRTPILGEYEEPAGEDGINLTQFLASLENYKSYIGQTQFLIFQVFYKNQIFEYIHYAEWNEAFDESFEEARQIFEEKENVIREQKTQQEEAQKKQAKQREEFLRTLLEELGDDDKFVSLRTQKAMQEYALARYPELSELHTHQLKGEISNLIARIQARKILQ